jgi:hypothetical protein
MKKKVEDLSRPEKRGAPGPTPLLVIAGLPVSTAKPFAATINNSKSRWRAVATAFSNNDRAIYDPAAILELGRLACEFADADRPDPDGTPSPSRIVVAYIDEPGSPQLWDVFGHAVWPVALEYPDWGWPGGLHWRHDIDVVGLIVNRALEALEQGPGEEIRLRLEAHRADDVLLLPPRNFHIDPTNKLFDRFRSFMMGKTDISSIEKDVTIKRFAFEKLAEFYKRVGGRGKTFAVDKREIVFAKSNHGQDGGQRDIRAGAKASAAVLQKTLESRFRFGTPLLPGGFQHDAQREGGIRFDREAFDCVTKGNIIMDGDHVNIFPSDVVTGKQSN